MEAAARLWGTAPCQGSPAPWAASSSGSSSSAPTAPCSAARLCCACQQSLANTCKLYSLETCVFSHLAQAPTAARRSWAQRCKLDSNEKTSVASLTILPFADLLLMKTHSKRRARRVKGQNTLKKTPGKNQGKWGTCKETLSQRGVAIRVIVQGAVFGKKYQKLSCHDCNRLDENQNLMYSPLCHLVLSRHQIELESTK